MEEEEEAQLAGAAILDRRRQVLAMQRKEDARVLEVELPW